MYVNVTINTWMKINISACMTINKKCIGIPSRILSTFSGDHNLLSKLMIYHRRGDHPLIILWLQVRPSLFTSQEWTEHPRCWDPARQAKPLKLPLTISKYYKMIMG